MSLAASSCSDLNTWNQGNDDLRGFPRYRWQKYWWQESGVGTGFDDGLVALTSSSLGFYRPGVTRIVPACHTTNTLLILAGFCLSGAPTLAFLSTDPNNLVGQFWFRS